jgi:hypothetical protein
MWMWMMIWKLLKSVMFLVDKDVLLEKDLEKCGWSEFSLALWANKRASKQASKQTNNQRNVLLRSRGWLGECERVSE